MTITSAPLRIAAFPGEYAVPVGNTAENSPLKTDILDHQYCSGKAEIKTHQPPSSGRHR
jgi:hypothetical protein